MSNILGISAGFHDAAISVVDSKNGEILFAGHSERFSRKKNDPQIHRDLLNYVAGFGPIDTIAYYENHWLKKLRQLRAGQDIKPINWTLKSELKQYFKSYPSLLNEADKVVGYGHHLSHAAAGFQTSYFSNATVVVIDAIGEFDTISVWDAWFTRSGKAKYKLLYKHTYPNSIGMFYSAATKYVGLRPMDEEYILMGMAAWGNPEESWEVERILTSKYIQTFDPPEFKENLHLGFNNSDLAGYGDYEIAKATQDLSEIMITSVVENAMKAGKSKNLVYMGGVALNCVTNATLGKYANNVWIMPNPGDAGSSLGAAALAYGKRLRWENAYLGYNISGTYPVRQVLNELLDSGICGVASGRAEFGPRALGNRSLLADPRGPEIKDKVNEIKRRQKFRPFAPMILEEYVNEYFEMPQRFPYSNYMQVVAKCKKPDEFPAIIHIDGTSRVQTVPIGKSGARQLLNAWYERTGCPMLLNTSLNIRGEPMVNTVHDAKRFEAKYGVKVFS